MTYFIKRFDRTNHKKKCSVEDFAQLSQLGRDTKYSSSMEKVAELVANSGFCSFPKIESAKLFKLTLFNFLVGNEDMHLKNFSLITRKQQIGLSPAYDLLNTTIAKKNTKEELALPLNGKKNNLKRRDFIEHFAIERLQLNTTTITNVFDQTYRALPTWNSLINRSFLSDAMKNKYLALLDERCNRIWG